MLCDQSIFSLFPTVNFLVSEPTMKDTPVGVDFYRIGERGRQHGPFGVLHPLHNVAGVSLEDIVNLSHIDKSRHFSLTHSLTHYLLSTLQEGYDPCEGYDDDQKVCSFCPNGIVDEDMIAPGSEYSCGDALGVATLLFNSTDECADIQSAEDICCQKKGNQSLN